MRFHASLTIIAVLAFLGIVTARADAAGPTYPVGVAQIEYVTATDHRPMWMAMFYPAALKDPSASQFHVPFTINLRFYTDVPFVGDGAKHPLIMLSHGRGSDAWQYVWLAQALASHGYIVAELTTIAPIPMTERSAISPTSSGSVRSTSASTSITCWPIRCEIRGSRP